MTEIAVWFPSKSWPLHWPIRQRVPYPAKIRSEDGTRFTVDLAADSDDLCEATTTMLFGLDRDRRTVVCIMPRGHDTPHMPQDPGSIARCGRLIIRTMGRARAGEV